MTEAQESCQYRLAFRPIHIKWPRRQNPCHQSCHHTLKEASLRDYSELSLLRVFLKNSQSDFQTIDKYNLPQSHIFF